MSSGRRVLLRRATTTTTRRNDCATLREWLETEGAGPEGAKREDLIALTRRICDLLKSGLTRGEQEVYGAA